MENLYNVVEEIMEGIADFLRKCPEYRFIITESQGYHSPEETKISIEVMINNRNLGKINAWCDTLNFYASMKLEVPSKDKELQVFLDKAKRNSLLETLPIIAFL